MPATKFIVWINQEHVQTIILDCLKWIPKETGGIIMGFRIKNEFWITDIVGPGPKAKHDMYSFSPDNDFHEEEMARIYEESGRIHTYLGDWHTHPQNEAYLSDRDKKTIRNIAINPACRLPQPLMMIIGTSPLELKAWLYQPKAIKTFRLIEINLLKTTLSQGKRFS